MSLIGEALKRARQEAAYQEAAREGRTWGPSPAYPPPRAKTWPLLAAGVAAGALLVAALGGGLYWLLGRDGREAAEVEARAEGPGAPGVAEAPAPGARDAVAPPVAAPVQDSRIRPSPGEAERLPRSRTAPGETGARSEARPSQPGKPALPGPGQQGTSSPGNEAVAGRDESATGETNHGTDAGPAREAAAGTPGTGTRPEPGPVASETAPSPGQARPGPASEEPRSGPAEDSARPAAPTEARPSASDPAGTEAAPAPAGETPTYVGEATLPGGGRLELTGIAMSDDQPVALINGRVMGPGEIIEGYTLVRIEENRVELRNRSGGLYLHLR